MVMAPDLFAAAAATPLSSVSPNDRYKHRHLVDWQCQKTGPSRLAPTKQMLRRHVVPTRHLRHDRAGRIGFRDDQPLGLNAPTTPASNPDPDIDPASWL
jgi:hypothetical protein